MFPRCSKVVLLALTVASACSCGCISGYTYRTILADALTNFVVTGLGLLVLP
jgi:hypothetical protein